MSKIVAGEGENGVNDNAAAGEPCICGHEFGHTLECVMKAKGLRSVEMYFDGIGPEGFSPDGSAKR